MSDYDDHDSGAPTEPSSVASPTGPNNSEEPPPVEENGRLYHPGGRYHFPCDQAEKDRLNLQHEAWLLTFNGELGLCPKIREMGHNVVDVGTGTGVWAIDYALKHRGSIVIGPDITGHPSPGLVNYKMEVDDCEDQDWQWLGNIDFVFVRAMTGCFETMEYIVDQAKFHLRPNGWLEIQDLQFPFQSDDGTLPDNLELSRMGRLLIEASAQSGRPMGTVSQYKSYLEQAGFEEITEFHFKWPLNDWPTNEREKELGKLTCENLDQGLEGLCLRLFTQQLNWTRERVLEFCSRARQQLKDRNIHAYLPIYVVYGRQVSPPPEAS